MLIVSASMEAQPLIRVTDLHRRYGELHAVRGVSFTVAHGAVMGLLGLNGAGKSTIMRMLCGVLAPSAGRIHIAGFDLLRDPLAAKRRIGYLPDRPPLYPELSVDEQLRFSARLHGIPRGRVAAALAQAKERCGLKDSGRRLIAHLSQGYRQRVGIAQAIVHRPAVVVLDEPTVTLDPRQISGIRALIREIGRACAVVLSTHILAEVQVVCDRVLILDEGRVALDAALDDLADVSVTTTRIALEFPPSMEELVALPGVHRVESLADGRWRLHHAASWPVDGLTRRALGAGWGLRELVPERCSLEQRFFDLTKRDLGTDQPGGTAPA